MENGLKCGKGFLVEKESDAIAHFRIGVQLLNLDDNSVIFQE
ncbi:hypothetical protein QQ054_06395 [Oscillatoria amoena NRMC-F 0135]|nr:hypothetical protein [Oscillatoria amoena NRMC-F 0135]